MSIFGTKALILRINKKIDKHPMLIIVQIKLIDLFFKTFYQR